MPDLDGIEATRRLIGARARDRRVLDPDHLRPGRVRVSRRCGQGRAASCSRTPRPSELVAAVRRWRAGDALLAPAVTRRLIEQFARLARPAAPPTPARSGPDRPRAARCCGWSPAGCPTPRSPSELFVSDATVKTHVGHVLAKLRPARPGAGGGVRLRERPGAAGRRHRRVGRHHRQVVRSALVVAGRSSSCCWRPVTGAALGAPAEAGLPAGRRPGAGGGHGAARRAGRRPADRRTGCELGAWYVPGRRPTRVTVLVANGNGGHRGVRAPLAAALVGRRPGGAPVRLPRLRRQPRQPERGRAGPRRARRPRSTWSTRSACRPDRLLYFGESLGAAVVTELATEHPPAGLVLRSPFVDLAVGRAVHYPFLPVRALLRDRYPGGRADRAGRGPDDGRLRRRRLDRAAGAEPGRGGCGGAAARGSSRCPAPTTTTGSCSTATRW